MSNKPLTMTGDLRAALETLRSLLRQIRFSGPFEPQELSRGNSKELLSILNFVFTGYSRIFTIWTSSVGYDMQGARGDATKFIGQIYKLMRAELNYRPVLDVNQLLSNKFAERKVHFLCDVIRFAKRTHNDLAKQSSVRARRPAAALSPGRARLPQVGVVRHESRASSEFHSLFDEPQPSPVPVPLSAPMPLPAVAPEYHPEYSMDPESVPQPAPAPSAYSDLPTALSEKQYLSPLSSDFIENVNALESNFKKHDEIFKKHVELKGYLQKSHLERSHLSNGLKDMKLNQAKYQAPELDTFNVDVQ